MVWCHRRQIRLISTSMHYELCEDLILCQLLTAAYTTSLAFTLANLMVWQSDMFLWQFPLWSENMSFLGLLIYTTQQKPCNYVLRESTTDDDININQQDLGQQWKWSLVPCYSRLCPTVHNVNRRLLYIINIKLWTATVQTQSFIQISTARRQHNTKYYATLYIVSQLKQGQNSNQYKYNVT